MKKETVRVTFFLKHDQSKCLSELDEILFSHGFWSSFPPKGVEIISWQVMMGIGQVVTLEIPVSQVREVNLAIENTAWGAFQTESYITYDFMPILEKKRKQEKQWQSKKNKF